MSVLNTEIEDGFIGVQGINLYFVRAGKGNRHRLITLHGGPGFSHDYFSPLRDLMKADFDIVFYDQFGCGKSDDPRSDDDYTLEYAIEELEGVRKTIFGDEKVNILGHSWGGLLALAYALRYQDHLISVISSGGLSSGSQYVSETRKLISEMPEKYRNYIEKHEKDRDFENPEYIEAKNYYFRHYVLRTDEEPPEITEADRVSNERGTYARMCGPSEFTVDGIIKDIEFTDRLHEITVPTLVAHGEYDEVTPEIGKTMHREIKNSEFLVYPGCSHIVFWEDRKKYLNSVEAFIKKNDRD